MEIPDLEARFDDERIVKGLVSDEEIAQLEDILIKMYLEKAKETGKEVKVVTDRAEYERLREKGEIFKGDKHYIFMEDNKIYMPDIAYYMLDTEEGLFYAKLLF